MTWIRDILPVVAAAVFAWMTLRLKTPTPSITTKNPNASYDYIVVGSGTSGGTLAARLAEYSNSTVLVLEAGKEGGEDLYEIPRTCWLTVGTDADWAYVTVPQKSSSIGFQEQRSTWPRGKILGGSSQLNAMAYVRGSRHDYDEWEKMDCTGWGWKDVLPYYLKMEYTDDEALLKPVVRERNGPLKIFSEMYSTFTEAFIQAGVELGYSRGDYNGENLEVFGSSQWNIVDGWRGSSTRVYLRPVMSRPNIHVTTEAHVTKVVIEGDRAVGVEFIKDGRKKFVAASKEVVLSAGTIGSPQILMLSGIGPAKHLNSLNIPVVKDLPVGEHLEDHMNTAFKFFATKSTANISILKDSLWERIKYKLTGKSLYYGVPALGTDAIAFLRLGDFWKEPYPNIQVYITPPNNEAELMRELISSIKLKASSLEYAADRPKGIPDDALPFTVYVSLINAKSRGTITLKSSDPFDYPDIDPRYLSEKQDVLSLVQGIRLIQRLVDTPSFKTYGVMFGETPFAPCVIDTEFDTDAYWECYVRHLSFTVYHPSSTCRMGAVNDKNTVVDPQLRVKGIKGLRVADASIMPVGTSGNINAPCFMIGEKAADIILGKKTV